MTSIATKYNWLLVDKDGVAVPKGAIIRTRRGEDYELTGGRPPHHEGSTGRVWVKPVGEPETTSTQEFFPTVFDLKWETV